VTEALPPALGVLDSGPRLHSLSGTWLPDRLVLCSIARISMETVPPVTYVAHLQRSPGARWRHLNGLQLNYSYREPGFVTVDGGDSRWTLGEDELDHYIAKQDMWQTAAVVVVAVAAATGCVGTWLEQYHHQSIPTPSLCAENVRVDPSTNFQKLT